MKTILITGASRGIGRAVAERFLKNGDSVLGTSTTGTALWQDSGLKMFRLDLARPESIEQCVREIKDLGITIDILINNAGMVVEDEVNSPTIVPEYVRKTLETNVFGVIDLTERIIPLMNPGGHIVNISSRAGSLGQDAAYTLNYPAYRISKAALNMTTRILAVRLKGKIVVSSVHPGWVKTDMGGSEADLEPSEAAESIFNLADSSVETGQFWYKNQKFPW